MFEAPIRSGGGCRGIDIKCKEQKNRYRYRWKGKTAESGRHGRKPCFQPGRTRCVLSISHPPYRSLYLSDARSLQTGGRLRTRVPLHSSHDRGRLSCPHFHIPATYSYCEGTSHWPAFRSFHLGANQPVSLQRIHTSFIHLVSLRPVMRGRLGKVWAKPCRVQAATHLRWFGQLYALICLVLEELASSLLVLGELR